MKSNVLNLVKGFINTNPDYFVTTSIDLKTDTVYNSGWLEVLSMRESFVKKVAGQGGEGTCDITFVKNFIFTLKTKDKKHLELFFKSKNNPTMFNLYTEDNTGKTTVDNNLDMEALEEFLDNVLPLLKEKNIHDVIYTMLEGIKELIEIDENPSKITKYVNKITISSITASAVKGIDNKIGIYDTNKYQYQFLLDLFDFKNKYDNITIKFDDPGANDVYIYLKDNMLNSTGIGKYVSVKNGFVFIDDEYFDELEGEANQKAIYKQKQKNKDLEDEKKEKENDVNKELSKSFSFIGSSLYDNNSVDYPTYTHYSKIISDIEDIIKNKKIQINNTYNNFIKSPRLSTWLLAEDFIDKYELQLSYSGITITFSFETNPNPNYGKKNKDGITDKNPIGGFTNFKIIDGRGRVTKCEDMYSFVEEMYKAVKNLVS